MKLRHVISAAVVVLMLPFAVWFGLKPATARPKWLIIYKGPLDKKEIVFEGAPDDLRDWALESEEEIADWARAQGCSVEFQYTMDG